MGLAVVKQHIWPYHKLLDNTRFWLLQVLGNGHEKQININWVGDP